MTNEQGLIERIEGAGETRVLPPGGAPDQETSEIMQRLSDLQQWCFLMTQKDSGGLPAGQLVQDVRVFIVERLFNRSTGKDGGSKA